ncbi:MAG: RNA polymerase sigma factor [Acidimicrobiales bacterium]
MWEPCGDNGEVVRVRNGDAEVVRASVARPQLFEAVFVRHHRRIWAYLARIGGRGSADDLAGEVFLAAFAERDRYDPERGSVVSWLYGIASNLQRTRFRSEARASRAFARAAAERVQAQAAVDEVEDAFMTRDTLDRVLNAMARLSISDREVIVLFVWERLSYEAMAAALGVEVGTVRSRLARARRRLRELAGLNGELTHERIDLMRKSGDG